LFPYTTLFRSLESRDLPRSGRREGPDESEQHDVALALELAQRELLRRRRGQGEIRSLVPHLEGGRGGGDADHDERGDQERRDEASPPHGRTSFRVPGGHRFTND